MYEIWKNGTRLAITDTVDYIRLHSNGCYVLCTAKDAQGIALRGVPCNLAGRVAMPDLETVEVKETDYIDMEATDNVD